MNKHNSQDERDGYWEVYSSNGQLIYKGHYNNGNEVGYWEWYYYYSDMIELTLNI